MGDRAARGAPPGAGARARPPRQPPAHPLLHGHAEPGLVRLLDDELRRRRRPRRRRARRRARARRRPPPPPWAWPRDRCSRTGRARTYCAAAARNRRSRSCRPRWARSRARSSSSAIRATGPDAGVRSQFGGGESSGARRSRLTPGRPRTGLDRLDRRSTSRAPRSLALRGARDTLRRLRPRLLAIEVKDVVRSGPDEATLHAQLPEARLRARRGGRAPRRGVRPG